MFRSFQHQSCNSITLETSKDFEAWLSGFDIPELSLVDDEMNLWAVSNGFLNPIADFPGLS